MVHARCFFFYVLDAPILGDVISYTLGLVAYARIDARLACLSLSFVLPEPNQAIAKESGATFINVRMGAVQQKWVGEGEKMVSAIFRCVGVG